MQNSALGIVSLVLGLVGLFMSGTIWCFIPCLLAIVIGIVAMTDYLAYKWSSICGICLAVMGCSIIIYQLALPYRIVNEVVRNEEVVNTTTTPMKKVVTNPAIEVTQPKKEVVVEQPTNNKEYYELGDTWVASQWKLTISDVQEVQDRNTYQDSVEAVYKVTYTLENTGYDDDYGLFIDIADKIIDSSGEIGINYDIERQLYLETLPMGARKTAEIGIGVKHKGDFVLQIFGYDTNSNRQSVKFKIKVN